VADRLFSDAITSSPTPSEVSLAAGQLKAQFGSELRPDQPINDVFLSDQ
jgi:hypothetical protein